MDGLYSVDAASGYKEIDMDKLKPCPFCGGEAWALPPTLNKSQLETSPKDCPGRFYSVVWCSDCGAELAGADFDADCSEAVAAWNRRADPQE